MSWLMKHPEVVYSEMEEGAVLLNLESRLYYSLDEAGLEIWRAIETARDIGDLSGALLAKFEASVEDASTRVRTFVELLRQEQLLVPGDQDANVVGEGVAAPASVSGTRRPLVGPSLVKHDEPLHEMSQHPFDPQLPLAE